MDKNLHYLKFFKDIDKTYALQLGEKAASLGEMYAFGLPVPNGFVLTPAAYTHFLHENKLDTKIRQICSTANFNHLRSLHQISAILQKMIEDAVLPEDLCREIVDAYKNLNEPLVSIKFSEISADTSSSASLNVKGEAVLLEKIKSAWAQQFNPRLLFFRHQQLSEISSIQPTLIVQQMIESEKSGLIYTVDPNTYAKEEFVIEAIFGLGELISLNQEKPDVYRIRKSDLTIIDKTISEQKKQFKKVGIENKIVNLGFINRNSQKISDPKILELAELGKVIEKYSFFPQKIEWALANDRLFVIQTLPLENTPTLRKNKYFDDSEEVILRGIPVNRGISSGPARIVTDKVSANHISPGDIVVIKAIKSFYLSSLKKASAVVIDDYDKNMQILFQSKNLSMPCIAGTNDASKLLKNDQIITLNATKGEIYKGGLSINPTTNEHKNKKINFATKLYISAHYKDSFHDFKNENIDGAFIGDAHKIIEEIGIHPKKLIERNEQHLLIEKLAGYISLVCETFFPKTVVYQLTNLTTADYRRLENGTDYDGTEENPLLGFHGAFRYTHDRDIFNLELEAIKKALTLHGAKNLSVSIPYLRTLEEMLHIMKIIKEAGFSQTDSLKLYITANIPANADDLEKFLDCGISGIFVDYQSILSLLFGTDRHNPEIFSELNKYSFPLLSNIEKIFKVASDKSLPAIILNEDLSNFGELVDALLPIGLTAISVPFDYLAQAEKILFQSEKKFINKI